MGNPILAVLGAVLLVALAVACAAWRRARGAATRAAEHLAASEAAREEAEHRAGERIAELEERAAGLDEQARALEARTWLADFPSDAVFRLVARASAELDEGERTYGVLRDEGGRIVPFVTARRMSHLESGDWFAGVRGQLVKLDPADLERREPVASGAPSTPPAPNTAAPPPTADAEATTRAALAPLPAADDDYGRTVMVARGPGAAPADPNAGLAWLEAIEGVDRGKRFVLPFAGATIGRDATNVVAVGDRGASRVHCRVEYEAGRFVLRDNDSTNGTLCNDEKVRECDLDFGDVVQLADTKLRYTCEGFELRSTDPAAAIAAFEQTLAREPDFVPALRNLAFLLEKDIARNREAQPLWERLARLESTR